MNNGLEIAALRDRIDWDDDLQEEMDNIVGGLTSSPAQGTTKGRSLRSLLISFPLLLLLITVPWFVLAAVERKRQAAVSPLRANRTEVTPDVMDTSSPTDVSEATAPPNRTEVVKPVTNATLEDEMDRPSPNELPPVGMSDDNFFIHRIYDDLHYRRVCAPVHSSHICMTVRYPFPIPPQDPTVPYAKPVQELFYDSVVTVHFVDGKQLESCRMIGGASSSTGDAAVKECLDLHHVSTDDKPAATVVWTRIRDGETELYGIDTEQQRRRVHDYFRHQVVFVLGASPSPHIVQHLRKVFDECQEIDKWDGLGSLHPFHGKKRLESRQDQAVCLPQDSRGDSLTSWTSLTHEDEWTLVLQDGFAPTSLVGRGFFNHSIPDDLSLVSELEKIKNITGWDQIKFTVIVEHPIAHIQNQDMMEQSYDYAVSLQNKWTQVFLNATQGPHYEKLEADGLEFNLIAFDGSPQFFPTASGGYTGKIHPFATEDEFLEQGGYEGWTPEMGSRCRGFLPPTSNLTKFNDLGRKFYAQNGLDMQWYGRTWEFINMVWFAMKGTKGWGAKGLDCTHGHPNIASMHKFFLMAMIDDHFDNTGVEVP